MERDYMNEKRIFGILICTMLITTVFPITRPVIAGDEENPEIEDEFGDTLFLFIDILSGWFFEDPDEPNYLYTAIKIRNLKRSSIGGLYQLQWTYDDVIYASFVEIGYQGSELPKGWRGGKYGHGSSEDLFKMPTCGGSIDIETGIITWKILKSDLGNPRPGDVFFEPWCKSCFFGVFGIMAFLRYIPFLRDLAPTKIDENGISRFEYGKNYIIQY